MIEPAPEVQPQEPVAPKGPPWWSPRRAWMPLILLLVLAGGAIAPALGIIEEREQLDRQRDQAAARSERLATRLSGYREDVSANDRLVEQQREIAQDCIQAAKHGVRFLHGVVQSLALFARGEEARSNEERVEANRMIVDANEASRLCARGVT